MSQESITTVTSLPRPLNPEDEIRYIWDEMKMVKRLHEGLLMDDQKFQAELYAEKYQYNEIMFGHESTLTKAVIYYLQQQHEKSSRECSGTGN